jgi:murein DD-endopeptidase MepM/ murein hydrolase activator NlpD
MSYALPTPTSYVSSSWQSHKDRNPPSSEPGTDYAASYGSDLYAPADGVITYVKDDDSGGGGRTVRLKPHAGQETQSLHNSQIWVSPGQHVTRGEVIGKTGASGYGDPWYYGPHCHQTLWADVAWVGPTIDFALYTGNDPAPSDPTTEDDMAFTIYQSGGAYMILGPETFLEIGGELTKKTGVDGAEALALYQGLPGSKTVPLSRRQYDVLRIHTLASQ